MNHMWSVAYDGAGRLLGTTDPLGHTTTFTTDSAGRVTRVTNPLQQTWQLGYLGGDRTSVGKSRRRGLEQVRR